MNNVWGDILGGGGGGGSVHYENFIKGEGGVKTYNYTQIIYDDKKL